MAFKKKWFLSLWFFWLVITAVYLLTFSGSGIEENWNYIPNNILGFFTPLGLGNLAGSIDHSFKWVAVLPFLFLTLLAGDIIGRKFVPRRSVRIIYNLVILILLTAAVDLMVWGNWISLYSLREVMGR